ncbi:M48 family metallopeptidase [candidate division KSB1 bacterium]|nr:M48 family metallopeptidase [candidate division KSB1 bacterium]
MKSKILHIASVGDVLIENSNRAKRLSISVKPFKGVRVAVPKRVSFYAAEKFVFEKIKWIRKHVENMRLFEETHNGMPDNGKVENTGAAKRKIKLRISRLAEKNGFDFNRITIRNQKSRWGSCSSKNNINLNIKLVKLPEELMDYVILHELVHTRIKNHSSDFWQELDKYVGNAKALAKQLKKYM